MRLRARPTKDRRASTRLRRLGIALGAAAAGVLVLFHAMLFAGRLRDLSILEPGVALQWIATIFLLGFLLYLRRHRISVLRGRSALSFWLVVLLLHLIPATPASLATWEHTDLLLAIPTTWLVTSSLILAAALVALLLALPLRSRVRLLGLRRRRRGKAALEAGFRSLLFARPPPLARLH